MVDISIVGLCLLNLHSICPGHNPTDTRHKNAAIEVGDTQLLQLQLGSFPHSGPNQGKTQTWLSKRERNQKVMNEE